MHNLFILSPVSSIPALYKDTQLGSQRFEILSSVYPNFLISAHITKRVTQVRRYRYQTATGLVPNSTTRTPATDMLYNTTNGQKFATSQHLDMSRCWTLALQCGKFVVQQVTELLSACPLVVLYN